MASQSLNELQGDETLTVFKINTNANEELACEKFTVYELFDLMHKNSMLMFFFKYV